MPNTTGRLILLGAGGHAMELAYAARAQGWPEIFHVVTHGHGDGAVRSMRPHATPLSDFVWEDGDVFTIAIGDGQVRRTLSEKIEHKARLAPPIVHPSAVIDGSPRVGLGSALLASSYVSESAVVGQHVHLNVGSSVSHESVLEDFVTIGPGSRICGNVHVLHGATIGAGATIINWSVDAPLVIGAEAVVAAGACVIRDVPPRTLVAGVPASVKREALST